MGLKDFIGNAWNNIKDTASDTWNNSKKVADNIYSKVKYYGKQAIDANRKATENTIKTTKDIAIGTGKFLNKHKGTLLDVAGKAAYVYGVATVNPAFKAAGVAMSELGQSIKEGEAKEEDKLKEERRLALYGNRYVAYSDMPRIHYSRRPFGYGIPSISPHSFRKPNYSTIDRNTPTLALPDKTQNKPKSKSKTKGKGKKK